MSVWAKSEDSEHDEEGNFIFVKRWQTERKNDIRNVFVNKVEDSIVIAF